MKLFDKYKATRGKSNQESGNDRAFFKCCKIVNKILENSSTPAIDIKAGPSQKEEKVGSSRQSRAIPGQGLESGILPTDFEKRQAAVRKNTIDFFLVQLDFQHTHPFISVTSHSHGSCKLVCHR